jgi:hypothetical protein
MERQLKNKNDRVNFLLSIIVSFKYSFMLNIKSGNMRRENKKLLRLNDEENRMLMELCAKYSMGVNEMLRYLIRKEYESIAPKNITVSQ